VLPFRIPPVVLVLALAAAQVCAQSWDPLRQGAGWARVDMDGSIAFYDPGSKKILSWLKDGGVIGELNVAGLPAAPEKWAVDASGNAWVVSGRQLRYAGKDGSIYSLPLPYEVADLAWDTQGLYLSYQCNGLFIEKRGYDTGDVIWYFKDRSQKEGPSPNVRYRIAVTEDKTLMVSHADRFQVDQFNGANGRLKGQVTFLCKGKPAPALIPDDRDRGPLAWWLDKHTAFQAVPASQVPALGMIGLLLAREDFSSAKVEFVPTGLSEQHQFLGMVDSDAAFLAPAGGLVFVPVH